MPDRVRIREVGPRDGFQNEPEVIATDDKVRLVELLAQTGLKRMEVTSFVRADVIPQLSDGREVLERADIPDDVAVSVLIPNERGLDNALELRDCFHQTRPSPPARSPVLNSFSIRSVMRYPLTMFVIDANRAIAPSARIRGG